MNWTEQVDALHRGSFFPILEQSISHDALASHLAWLQIVRHEPILDWVMREGGLVDTALRHGDSEFDPVLGLLLGRLVVGLESRRDPRRLQDFWSWAAPRCGAPEVAAFWNEHSGTLAATCKGDSLSAIRKGEHSLAQLALAGARELQGYSRMNWATRRLAAVALERAASIRHRAFRAHARVVFAWDHCGSLPDSLRPGLLVELELLRQNNRCWSSDPAPFGDSFRKAMEQVRSRVGDSSYFTLEHNCGFLGSGALVGGSGAMAVWLAQHLAGRAASRALFPWVVVTATVDWESPAKPEVAGPVGLLAPKLEALAQDGVRIVLVGAGESESMAAPPEGMVLIPVAGEVRRIARKVIRLGLTCRADVSRHFDQSRVRERRRFLAKAATLSLGGVLSLGASRWYHAKDGYTLAMRHHDRSALARLASEYLTTPALFSARFGTRESGSGCAPWCRWVDSPPEEAFLPGVEILEDSKLFDSVDWRPVPVNPGSNPTKIDVAINAAPIEPAYFTRVLRLRKKPGWVVNKVAIEVNTSGCGVVPYIPRPDREFVRCAKSMYQSKAVKNSTFTGFILVDVSKLGNHGEEFEVAAHAVYFNAAQDQSARGKLNDWWGSRVHPATAKSNLAIHLPPRGYHNVSYWLRVEEEPHHWKSIRVGVKPTSGRVVPSPSTPKGWFVWEIPCPPADKRPTVYSIEWTWPAPAASTTAAVANTESPKNPPSTR